MNSYYLTLVLKSDLEDVKRKALLDSLVSKLVGEDGKVGKGWVRTEGKEYEVKDGDVIEFLVGS